MMKRRLTLPAVVCAIVFLGGLHVAAPLYSEPIEPTRTLQGGANQPGLLSVYSEPPTIDLWVDGKKMGKTPVTSIQLPPGEHLLRLGDSEQKISITSGKPSTYSWFKGALIEVVDPTNKPSEPTKLDSTVEKRGQPKPPESASRRAPTPSDPFYWPLNPRGPIN
jgi:hypothetical protein